MNLEERNPYSLLVNLSAVFAVLVVSTSAYGGGSPPDRSRSSPVSSIEEVPIDASGPPEPSRAADPSGVGLPGDAGGTKLATRRPIARFATATKKWMTERGWIMNIDMAFYDQYATTVLRDQDNFGTFAWRVWSDWNFANLEDHARLFLEMTLFGSSGLNYDVQREHLTRNIGSISVLNANYYPNSAALDEFIVKMVSHSDRYVALIGRVDLSNRFDTNRVANDGFHQFVSFALQNNLSIPWSVYGGLGGFTRYNSNGHFYVMAAVSRTDSAKAFEFWKTTGQGNWYEMGEVGATVDVPSLGVGHYRLTPWHSHLDGSDGWGFGLNFDQELGRDDIIAFFRFGLGDPDVTAVKTFVSAGAVWTAPFGRKNYLAGIGFAWSNPSSDENLRDETLFEFFYRFALTPWIQFSPDLQVVLKPASNPQVRAVWVPGVRLTMNF